MSTSSDVAAADAARDIAHDLVANGVQPLCPFVSRYRVVALVADQDDLITGSDGPITTVNHQLIHRDRPDDPAAGVKSSARALGLMTSKPWLMGFYALAVLLFGMAGYLAGMGWPFWIGLTAGAAQLVWQVQDIDLDNAKDCLAKFKSNRLFGWLLLAGIIGGHFA